MMPPLIPSRHLPSERDLDADPETMIAWHDLAAVHAIAAAAQIGIGARRRRR
jgi:hypothetical protein